MTAKMKIAYFTTAMAVGITTHAIADPTDVPSNCFQRAIPEQPAGEAVLGVGITQDLIQAGKALNEVELNLLPGPSSTVILSLSAIRDVHFVLTSDTARAIEEALGDVRELDERLERQGRENYNEPLVEIPILDSEGRTRSITIGISRVPRWNCFSNGEWTPLSGDAQSFLVLRMPFALEYSPDHRFTGLQFDLDAVTKLTRIFKNVLQNGSPASGLRT